MIELVELSILRSLIFPRDIWNYKHSLFNPQPLFVRYGLLYVQWAYFSVFVSVISVKFVSFISFLSS